MNILKTFEIFLREPLTVLKQRFVQIVSVQSGYAAPSSVNVDMLGKKAQITVVNNEKMYNLLQTAMYKQQRKELAQISSSRTGQQVVLGRLLQRR